MSDTASGFPIPPDSLIARIGPMGDTDRVGEYERTGLEHRQLIDSVLPADWSWQGRRVLDFGCGSGRVIRRLGAEATEAEIWGCDLDTPSIDWLQQNLSPPFQFFESADVSTLPQEDGYFDLIYAFSVYTHLTQNWAGWMLEHHRVLKDDGLLFVTFLGEGMTQHLIGEKWNEDRIGMNTLMHGNPWDHGGPIAFNSPWWIHAHWGRAFEILDLRPQIGDGRAPNHGCVLMRKKPGVLSEEDLTRLEPDEPREILALQHQIEQQREETLEIRRLLAEAQAQSHDQLVAQAQRLAEMESSSSWRLTAPLRATKQRLRPGSRR
ncbi:MAG TPA: methyltransferase domain-containing protein [Solirubrobacterales bacterium]|nr:methyltransferase domain-containing protein [Solirubrobacterales bacterium]